MKKQQLLWLAIAVLFVLNISTIAFILLRDSTGHPHRGPRAFDKLVVQTLQLNKEQEQQFNHLKRAHHETILELDKAMKAPIEQYFSLLLSKDATPGIKEQLEQKMEAIYQEKLQVTYSHFEQLKSICSPEQQQHFDKLIPELMQVMQPPPPGGEHPPEEN